MKHEIFDTQSIWEYVHSEENKKGLMPHPEHAVEAGFGPESGGGIDGQGFFSSAVRTLVAKG